jgi:hypothetical protein
MKYVLTCLAGLLALGFVAVTPDAASAGYRNWGWGGGWGPGFGIMSVPATPMDTAPITATATPMGTVTHGGGIAIATMTATGISRACRLPVQVSSGREEPFEIGAKRLLAAWPRPGKGG